MAMKRIQIAARLFDKPNSRRDLERSRRALAWLMFAMANINKEYLLDYPNTVELYKSPVRYRAEVGTEEWQDIPTTLAKGWGDCEDLATWRCGELMSRGIEAMPYITWRDDPSRNGVMYHAVVRWPNGVIEDPSRALGIHGLPITGKPVFVGVDV